ncbi:MAG: protein-glutamate O-methyltransferase CheR [Ruminococcaceae bacterium]|nr:protein-glutamate O-methyltransferase CheR [Oscillospiraceae bacterium]
MNLKLTQQDFERLVTFMKKNYGINLEKKSVLIEGRLSNMIAKRGFTSFKDYLDFALSDKTGNETIQLVNKLTTNHTFFLREPEHFTFLKNTILPYIEKANADHSMNLWCAASSKGHEPYTILFTILDYFGPNISKWRINYIATDIDTEVLNFARAGVYPATELKDVPQGWITKYFRKVDDANFAVRDNYRMMIQFKQFNLMDKIVTQRPYDFISCRNVMIYFDMETKNALVERFYDVTKEGGYLFTGHSESVSRNTRYTYIQPAVYRRQSADKSKTTDPKLGLTRPIGTGTIGTTGTAGSKLTTGSNGTTPRKF